MKECSVSKQQQGWLSEKILRVHFAIWDTVPSSKRQGIVMMKIDVVCNEERDQAEFILSLSLSCSSEQ